MYSQLRRLISMKNKKHTDDVFLVDLLDFVEEQKEH